MSSLNLYGYNLNKIDTVDENVDFLFNLEQISRSSKKTLGYLGVKVILIAIQQNSIYFNKTLFDIEN